MARIDFPRTRQRRLLIRSILGKFCLVILISIFKAWAITTLTLVGVSKLKPNL